MRLDVQTLRESFSQATEQRPDFGRRFIARLLGAHPELVSDVAELGDAAEQTIGELVHTVLRRVDEPHWVQTRLLSLGAQHPGDVEKFEWVLNALVVELRESMGEHWTPRMERAWTHAAEGFVRWVKVGARAAEEVFVDAARGYSVELSMS